MVKIGLLWHDFPSENLGVGALTHSHLLLLDEAVKMLRLKVEYCVVGMDQFEHNRFDSITSSEVKYEQFSLRNLVTRSGGYIDLYNFFSVCDVFFDLSAGDSFSDIYGAKRFVQQSLTKILALKTARPLVLCPQTIGPFDHWYGRIVSNYIMKRSERLFARDGLSYNYLEKAHLGDKSSLATDLAFALPYDKNLFKFRTDVCNIGINVSALLYNGGYDRNNQFGMTMNYITFVDKLIHAFGRMSNVQIHLIPHVISDKYTIEDDYRVCKILSAGHSSCLVAPRFTTPLEAKSYISNLDFFTGARMHATIAAYSSGVPVVPISYSRKFSGLYGSLGYKCLVDGKTDTNDKALDIVLSAFDNRMVLSQEVSRGNEIARNRLGMYSSYLRDILKAVSNG